MKITLQKVAFLFTSFLGTFANAQTIPNPNFENWNMNTYQEPNGWATSNPQSVNDINTVTTTTVNGFSGKAVRMQTYVVGVDTSFGYIAYGAPGFDPVSGQGGLPYTQKPTNITGYYRYSLPVNDTALLLVHFKKNGLIISTNTHKIRGTGTQATFTSFTYTLAVSSSTDTPDSVVIAFASSNVIPNVGVQNNSYLEVDEINFTGPGITQNIINGSFESWNTVNSESLAQWSTAGGGVTKVTPGFYGANAVELQTNLYPGNFVGQCGITNGVFPGNGPPKLGKPYTLMQDTLYGFYKFSGSNDSGVIYVNLRNSGSSVGGGMKFFKTQSNWTFFKVPISAGTAPDTMRLEIYSSQPGSTVTTAVGSKFTIDNLYLYSAPNVSIKVNMLQNNFALYPNPCKDVLNIKTLPTFTGIYQVYDALGNKVILSNTGDKSDQLKLNVESLSKGIYFMKIENSEGTTTHKFIKE